MKRLLFTITVILTGNSFAQEKAGLDFYATKSDTIFCTNLKYLATAQGYLGKLYYTDLNGKEVKIEGQKKLMDVVTLHGGNFDIDKIPQKPDKPEKYVKFAPRVVDGKLIINYYSSGTKVPANMDLYYSTTIVKYFIKMPDGTFYDICDDKDMNAYVYPYLKKCSAFTSAYKGKYVNESVSFEKMINLYNSLCGSED